MSLPPVRNIPAPGTGPGGRAAADPGRAVQARPTVALVVDDEIDKVLALTTGADDYVTKPFGGRELAARLRAILRRLQPPHTESAASNGEAAEAALTFAGITIDPGRRSVHTSSGRVTVTALDYDLLLALARNPGLVLSRRQLLAAVWGDDAYIDERVVDVHIRTLRRALGDDAAHPSIIETVRSVGYRFLPPAA
jgi:DNA-binding response OmpR family regulator